MISTCPAPGCRLAIAFSSKVKNPELSVLLTAANWMVQRLPGQVVEHQRTDVIKTLAAARELVIEVHLGRPPAILIRVGSRALVKILAR